jgi:lysophospholipase L1-like esterase
MNYKQLYRNLIIIIVMACFGQAPVALAAQPESIRITWPLVADAVGYELEITDQYLPPGQTIALARHVITDVTVQTTGTELSGELLPKVATLWWRVRAVDVQGQPLTDFTESKHLSEGEINPQAPLPVMSYPDERAVPLYPAYSWIPSLNAAGYDVEILNVSLSVNERSQQNQQIAWYHVAGGISFDCYDWHSYRTAGTYYWRVRAVDDFGQALGTWSSCTAFAVTTQGYAAAALGDSITHGGGAISSPPGTPIYDWTQSVTVPVKNLGRSGDTTDALIARFDQDVLPFHPAILIIAGGINDVRDGTDASQIINNLCVIKQKCLARDITPVFVTLAPINPQKIATIIGAPLPPQWQHNWRAVNAWILNQPNSVDTASLLKNAQGLLPDRLSADGLHPDSEGKRVIGQAISQKLFELQNISR